jgi:hypothetical protein
MVPLPEVLLVGSCGTTRASSFGSSLSCELEDRSSSSFSCSLVGHSREVLPIGSCGPTSTSGSSSSSSV